MRDEGAASGRQRYDGERYGDLFDVAVRAVRRRRWTRHLHAQSASEVRALYRRHRLSLDVLPDD